MIPQTRYAKTADGVHIAYQVVGGGPVDLVFVMGWTSNVEAMWEEPGLARFLSRLASFSRLVLFDKRGMGLSDRVPDARLPSLETRMDDVRAVMDAVGSERAAALGDRRWKELLEAHHARVRGQLARYRGREIGTTGGGFLATFDGPARAIRCAAGLPDGEGPRRGLRARVRGPRGARARRPRPLAALPGGELS